tara:strand:- start:412 stop:531 length:120 start_codon:yes stop_codon:yes gene_type:complete
MEANKWINSVSDVLNISHTKMATILKPVMAQSDGIARLV